MWPARTIAFASLLVVAVDAPAWAAVSDAGAPVVAAGAEPSAAPTRAHAIGVDVGFASAVGMYGVTFTQAFSETFRVEAGVGQGFSGTQVSLMPKLVLGGAHDHFVTGVGIGYTIDPDSKFTEGNPVWLNIDALGYEHLFSSGLAFSFAVGITRGLGGGRFCVVECDSSVADKQGVGTLAGPQGRMGVAYWF